MPEGSSGLLDKLKVWRRGSTDAVREPYTTHREAGQPLPPAEVDSSLPINKMTQPGDNATELHPGDAEAMDAHKARQISQSDFAAQAITESGVQATHPVHEPKYPEATQSEAPKAN